MGEQGLALYGVPSASVWVRSSGDIQGVDFTLTPSTARASSALLT